MNISPIKTTRDYERTLIRIEQLMDAKPGTKTGDELDVLTIIVEVYEAKRHAVSPPDPVEAIRFRMEQLGMTRRDLEALLGGRGRVSEILSRKRSPFPHYDPPDSSHAAHSSRKLDRDGCIGSPSTSAHECQELLLIDREVQAVLGKSSADGERRYLRPILDCLLAT